MDNIINPLDEDSYRYTPSAMSQLSFLPMRGAGDTLYQKDQWAVIDYHYANRG